MASKGFLVAATNSPTTNYVWLASVLARTVNATQRDGSRLSLITDSTSHVRPEEARHFEHVIRIDKTPDNKKELRTLFYDLTPYDQTICLDADMLFLHDYSSWWSNLKGQAISWAKAYNYKGALITSRDCRKDFDASGLPDVYSAFFYFEKNEVSREFFDLQKAMISDWRKWRKFLVAPYSFSRLYSTDIAYAVAAKLLDVQPAWQPGFVHFKHELQNPGIQQGLYTTARSLDTATLQVEKYKQWLPFHYVDKDFLEAKILHLVSALEEKKNATVRNV